MTAARIALIFVMLVAMAAPTRAEDKAAARQAYAEGSKYYDLNQYDEALEAFKRAYWNFEEPAILYNIAQCHRALGHKKEALDFFRSYLRKSSDDRSRQMVEKIIDELNSAIEKEKAVAVSLPVGTIATEAGPALPPPSPPKRVANAPQPFASVDVTAPPAARTDKPVWKRAWLWGVVVGVVVAGAAVGVGVVLGTQPHPPNADAKAAF